MKHLITLLISIVLFQIPLRSHPSWGIVVDYQGYIYFADITQNGRGTVWKLSSDGNIEALLKDFHAHNVSLDSMGNLITAHGEGNHLLVRINKDGTIDTLAQELDHKKLNGGNLTYTQDGRIIFGAEKKLWQYDNGTRYPVSDYTFGWNQTVYVSADGYVYGPDIGDSTGKIIEIDPFGRSRIVASGLITKTDRPYDPHNDILLGISKSENGHLFIAEMAGGKVIEVDENGERSDHYISEEGWVPTGLYFRGEETFILEYRTRNMMKGPRVVKLDSNGNRKVLYEFGSEIPTEREQGFQEPHQEEGGTILYWLASIATILVLMVILLIWKWRYVRV